MSRRLMLSSQRDIPSFPFEWTPGSPTQKYLLVNDQYANFSSAGLQLLTPANIWAISYITFGGELPANKDLFIEFDYENFSISAGNDALIFCTLKENSSSMGLMFQTNGGLVKLITAGRYTTITSQYGTVSRPGTVKIEILKSTNQYKYYNNGELKYTYNREADYATNNSRILSLQTSTNSQKNVLLTRIKIGEV